MKNAALFLIRVYQKGISPVKPPCCRFYPSCSSYAAQAVGRFGAVRGGYLAARRLLKCHPFNPGGFDPVPEEFPKKRHLITVMEEK
jgi:putative membrane protein insertion efficiency factor